MIHDVVFLDRDGFAQSVLIKELPFAHRWTSYGYTAPETLVARLAHATIAVTAGVPLSVQQLEQLPALQMISLAMTGTDVVDLDYCRERGIEVSNVPGYGTHAVAEHALGMIFELMRNVGRYHQLLMRVREQGKALQSTYFDHPIRDLRGKVLGIIGHGPIALRLAELATRLEMQVLFHDRDGHYQGERYLPLEALLKCSDVVSINCPLTPQTRHLIGRQQLQWMKRDAVLINTARGAVINEPDLIWALQHGEIAGAALDVVTHEPITLDEPLLHLAATHNLILNPHIAWSSAEAMQGLMDAALENVTRFVTGR
ncbi:glycerate dehydrogenase [Pseudomonas sp. ok272]|uniref:NAD(P)-dependent oxidoreductase n=1 Tax=unclassified Pseudomonas TaxID=196821 RepID=UPI0008B69F2B|nr:MULTISPECIES: NAD(P)-dependent oxidoreductase [unclassified Pseudomonas]SEN52421.1 glycerate dehydrogenase [Pseudomonas sp. ok272]SFN33133.1 glycerate dehydrogenase [Pseudomonas sp. ok602]